MQQVAIFWFRRDLRWEDNVGLSACVDSGLPVLPVFIFDTYILSKLSQKSDPRVSFIHSLVSKLYQKARKCGGEFKILHGEPLEIFKTLSKEYHITSIYCNRDYEPYARQRDSEIEAWCTSNNLQFKSFKDHVVFEKSEIIKKDQTPYSVFTLYSKNWREKLTPCDYKEANTSAIEKALLKGNTSTLLSIEQLGFKASQLHVPPPRLHIDTLVDYEQRRDYPALQGTTRVSPHLRFGALSIRSLVRLGKAHSEKWLTELIWRDFYQMILWYHPETVNHAFKPKYDRIPWSNNETHFAAWCEGRTGYPLVDAGMRELNETGFMHNRVRMVVASFLTKHLLLDWRWGERYFAEKLMDFELASNVGGWQWAAGSGCDAAPYFRIFNPQSQLEKFDPDRVYVKKWIPEFGTSIYPQPIIAHKEARDRALATYKKALA